MRNKKQDETVIIQKNDVGKDRNIDANNKSEETVVLPKKNNTNKKNVKNHNSDKTVEFFEGIGNDEESSSGFYKDSHSFEKTLQKTDFDIQKLFPGRTKSGHIKINRNFLKDAEPFSLERLNIEARQISKGIFTGFNFLDLLGEITSFSPMIFYGLPRKEIVLILLNILLNMTNNYSEKHFLYYTYSENRIDLEVKLINTLGDNNSENEKTGSITTNLKHWIDEIASYDLEILIEKVKSEKKFTGIKKFLNISDRIHIIDSRYGLEDLRDSIKSFSKVFDIAAIIIDNADEITLNNEDFDYPKIKYISGELRNMSLDLNKPLLYGYTSTDYVKKDLSININLINYSTRIVKIRKEYPKILLTDHDSGKESVFLVDYETLKISEQTGQK